MTRDVAVVGLEWDVADLAESCPGVRLVGFIDPDQHADVREVQLLGADADWDRIQNEHPGLHVALAVDDPVLRAHLYATYPISAHASLVSPEAYISPRAQLGPAAIVQRKVVVMPFARLGRACKLNVGAAIHHEASIGDFVTIAPGASVLGRVVVGDRAYIGAGSIIRQRCRVGEGAVIGAGAVVVDDVPADATVVGVPASRRLR